MAADSVLAFITHHARQLNLTLASRLTRAANRIYLVSNGQWKVEQRCCAPITDLSLSSCSIHRLLTSTFHSQASADLAATYAALILADSEMSITADNIIALTSAACVELESIWASLLVKALEVEHSF